jgi:hypothetical protein
MLSLIMNRIKQLIENINLNFEKRKAFALHRKKNLRLMASSFYYFNNGSTCLAGNRVKGDKERVNIDHTSFYK